jgi:septal ring factor EnvC (AmiA/AmiB activator)
MADASHSDPSGALHYGDSGEHTKHRAGSLGYAIVGIILVAAILVLALKLKQEGASLASVQNQLEQTNSDLTAAKASLAASEGKATTLQSQLDQVRRENNDLQTRVKNAEDANATFQTQLSQAKADAQSQQRKLQTQVDQMEAQVNLADESTARLKQDLTAAQRQNEELKAQLAKAQEAASAATAPMKVAAARPLPLASQFKKSFWGGSFTLELKNQGSAPLNLNLEITGSDKTPSRAATIESGGTFKLSDVAPGAKIVVTGEGFQPMTLTAQ